MRARGSLIALAAVVVAVVIQTTLFAPGAVRILGAAPNLVLLVVVVAARWLDPEPALYLGFTAGILVDLLGSGPLGLWAMSLTVVAYLTVRLRDHVADGPFVVGAGILGLTFAGQLVFVVFGTLFGLETVTDPQLARYLVLPSVYNMVLAAPLFWIMAKLLSPQRKVWAAS